MARIVALSKRMELGKLSFAFVSLLGAALSGCETPAEAAGSASPPERPPPAPSQVAPLSTPAPRPAPLPPPREGVVLIAGGDVCFGRALGQTLLRDSSYDPFASVASLFATADLRFVNLESQLSDQGGETQSPRHPLVFTGPPAGADALSRAGVEVVSAANNHMWDYGERAFFETLENLDRVGVSHAGAGKTYGKAHVRSSSKNEA